MNLQIAGKTCECLLRNPSTDVHVTSFAPKEMKACGLWTMKKLKAFSKQALELIHNQSHLLYTQEWLPSYDTELHNPLKRTKEHHIQSKDTRIPYWFCLCFHFACVSASQVALLVKNPPANAGDAGLISGSGRSPGQGNGYRLQYSCLGNPMDRGAWRATAHGVAKSPTQLSD